MIALRDWRDSLDERTAGVWSDLRWHLLVAERAGRVGGMTSGTYLGSLNIGMVGYLVLEPALRGKGVGPRLRTRLRARFERDAAEFRGAPLGALVGEVECDNRWLRTLVARAGALALDFPYYQPPLRRGASPQSLVLYYQPLGASRQSLRASEVRRLLFAIWRRLYRIPKPLGHATFRRMLQSLRGRARIRSRVP